MNVYFEGVLSVRTKTVMIAHTFGNPNSLEAIMESCDEKKVLLTEDNCNAPSGKYTMDGSTKLTEAWVTLEHLRSFRRTT